MAELDHGHKDQESSSRAVLRWIAPTAMMAAVLLLPGHHWFTNFLWFFAVLLFMNRRNLRTQ
jgi:hypothetical protein